jgi:hypothetical protein
LDRGILVQLPKPLGGSRPPLTAHSTLGLGHQTIDGISREHAKRAAAKTKEEAGADADYGFRLYRLEESSGQALDQLECFDTEPYDTSFTGDYASKFDLNGAPSHDTVLATRLVKDGYGLTATTKKVRPISHELNVCVVILAASLMSG